MAKIARSTDPITGAYPTLAQLVRILLKWDTSDERLTLKQASIIAGVSASSIGMMANGERPSMELIIDFARGMNVDPNPLLRAAEYPEIQYQSSFGAWLTMQMEKLGLGSKELAERIYRTEDVVLGYLDNSIPFTRQDAVHIINDIFLLTSQKDWYWPSFVFEALRAARVPSWGNRPTDDFSDYSRFLIDYFSSVHSSWFPDAYNIFDWIAAVPAYQYDDYIDVTLGNRSIYEMRPIPPAEQRKWDKIRKSYVKAYYDQDQEIHNLNDLYGAAFRGVLNYVFDFNLMAEDLDKEYPGTDLGSRFIDSHGTDVPDEFNRFVVEIKEAISEVYRKVGAYNDDLLEWFESSSYNKISTVPDRPRIKKFMKNPE